MIKEQKTGVREGRHEKQKENRNSGTCGVRTDKAKGFSSERMT